MNYKAKPKKIKQKDKSRTIVALLFVLVFLIILIPIQTLMWLKSFDTKPEWFSEGEQIEIEFGCQLWKNAELKKAVESYGKGRIEKCRKY